MTAAALSAVLPGLGQLAQRHWIEAALWLSPLVALMALAMLVAVSVAGGDPTAMALALLRPEVLVAILMLDVLLVVQRIAAAAAAYRRGRAARPGRAEPAARAVRSRRWIAPAALAIVLVVTGSVHVAVAAGDIATLQLVTTVFDSGDAGGDAGDEAILPAQASAAPSPSPVAPPSSPTPAGSIPSRDPGALGEPSPSPSPAPSPSTTPVPTWAKDGRLDVLLVGTDAGPDRWKLRTDTMIVLSVDVASGRAALFGIPRNLVNVPLPAESADAFPCHCFPKLINGLWVYADGHPGSFPGGRNRAWRAVAGAVSALIGRPLDGLVVVDLNGFIKAIDALGGLRIKVPELLVDDRYPKPDGSGLIRLRIEPGWQTMDGETALAYARSRHQDSDYGRMHRQQQVLLALRAQAKPCRLIPRLPSLLPVIERSVWTTFKVTELPDLLELAARVKVSRVQGVTFTPPRYPEYLRSSDIARIQAVVRDAFKQKDGANPPAELDVLPGGC